MSQLSIVNIRENKMHALRSAAILASVLVAFSIGCGRTPLSITNAPVVTQKANPTADEIAQAIIRAGAASNWRITKQASGELAGVRAQGGHSAAVSISYSPTAYSVQIKDVTRGDAERVHRMFNNWVRELEMNIKTQLGTL